MNKQQKTALMTWIGLCVGMRRIDEIVEMVNQFIKQDRNNISLVGRYDTPFELVRQENGGYKVKARVYDCAVTDLNDSELTVFTREHYIKFLNSFTPYITSDWEDKLRCEITNELVDAKFNYIKTFWGKVKRIEIETKGELTNRLSPVITEGKACYGKCAKFEITPWFHFGLDSYSRGSVVVCVLHDTWFRYATTYYGQNGRVTKKERGYHLNLLAIGITKLIKDVTYCVQP